MARKQKTSEVEICHCYQDFNSRSCIVMSRTDDEVKYIPLTSDEPLTVKTRKPREFDEEYVRPLPNYPLKHACGLFAVYCRTSGASEEVLDFLEKHTPLLTTEARKLAMTVNKKRSDEAKVRIVARGGTAMKSEPAKTTKSAATKTTPAKAAKAPAAKAPAAKAPAAKAKSGEKKGSAAQMFQDLIMAGKLTDDQIFAKVKAEYGLDDKKRGYVGWYRNHLRKAGKNPPEPK